MQNFNSNNLRISSNAMKRIQIYICVLRSGVLAVRASKLRCCRLLWRAGIAPYMAIELAVFDLLPGDMPAFARGFSAALLATTCCYPLDTLRCGPLLSAS